MAMTGASQEHGIRAGRGAGDVGRRFRRSASMVTAALTVCLLPLSAARAQTPFVPDDWKYGKRQESSTLHYCVDARDPDLPVARKIGEAIATALLLQPREHVIGENVAGESLDNLYQVFLGTCDLYLGFKLIPDAYPEWMKLTRPYYRASYVFAAIDTSWRALSDMPKSSAIGATMGTGADLRLIQYRRR
jgi:polar amino acid transport system substrate-binding protein